MNPTTRAKTYQSLLKTLLNNKKIPCIPPLFHRGKYVTNFKKKAELLNTFFAKQCFTIQNPSELPLTFTTKRKSLFQVLLSTVMISQQLFIALTPTKLMDMISICMQKISDKAICKPLELISQSCIKRGKFLNEWKIANVAPIHEK